MNKFLNFKTYITTRDSSVGRAEDCRVKKDKVILRSLVQIRFVGFFPILHDEYLITFFGSHWSKVSKFL